MAKRGNLGDTYDPYAGSAYYGVPDTFYEENPDFAWNETDASEVTAMQGFINDFNESVARLDEQIAALRVAESNLLNVRQIAMQNASDAEAWENEYFKISNANAAIQTAQNAVNEIRSWWNSVKGVMGLSGARRGAQSLLNGALGALPFAVPWGVLAAITGSIAAIAAVVASANSLIDRLNIKAWNDENIRRSQQGLPPLPKPDMQSQSLFGDLSDLGRTVTFAAIAYFLLPPLLKRMERK